LRNIKDGCTYKDFFTNNDIDEPLPEMPQITITDPRYVRKLRKYNILRMVYNDNYMKRQSLIYSKNLYCNEIELKYLLFKEHVLQCCGEVDKCLVYEMFDILHYMTILLCYHDEIKSKSENMSAITKSGCVGMLMSMDKYGVVLCDM
jgi:hypothetical protein